jgi:protein-L-isoaspartate(D-aspartate) O-methyltransferase
MSSDQLLARENMIEQQIRPWEVLDSRVLDVFRELPRDRFMPDAYRAVAYTDVEIPIGHGERTMKPVVEGRTLQSLELTGSERVLEIGTGSGFLTACLSRLARSVVSIERHVDLVATASGRLAEHGLDNAHVIAANAMAGFDPADRFDAIVLTGAVDTIPQMFLDWLAPNGRLFAVRGRSPAMEAVLVTRIDDAHFRTDSLFETELDYLHGAAPMPRFVL